MEMKRGLRVARAVFAAGEIFAAKDLQTEQDDGLLARGRGESAPSASATARDARWKASSGLERTADLLGLLGYGRDHGRSGETPGSSTATRNSQPLVAIGEEYHLNSKFIYMTL